EAVLDLARDLLRSPAQLHRDPDRRHLVRPARERLDGWQRQDDAVVDEAVAGGEDADDWVGATADGHAAAKPAPGLVPDHRLLWAAGPAAGDDHEPLHRELVRVEPEDEPLRCHVDLDPRRLVDATDAVEASFELVGQVGAGEVGDVALEDAE